MQFAKAPRHRQMTYRLGSLRLEQVKYLKSCPASSARPDMLAVSYLGDILEEWPGTIAKGDHRCRYGTLPIWILAVSVYETSIDIQLTPFLKNDTIRGWQLDHFDPSSS